MLTFHLVDFSRPRSMINKERIRRACIQQMDFMLQMSDYHHHHHHHHHSLRIAQYIKSHQLALEKKDGEEEEKDLRQKVSVSLPMIT